MSSQLQRTDFINADNETMLRRILIKDFQRRVGAELTPKQVDRLGRTVRFYMNEVVNTHPTNTVKFLNTEVLQAVVPDYMSYLRRRADTPEKQDDDLTTDVTSRFDRLQAERQEVRATRPPEPEFRIALDEDGPSPASQFERILKQREEETARFEGVQAPQQPQQALAQVQHQAPAFMTADDSFRAGTARAAEAGKNFLVEREQARQQRAIVPTEYRPDPRREMFAQQLAAAPVNQGFAQSATLALPSIIRDRPALPQDILKSQDPIVDYKEVEYNLFLNSADRDWTNNSSENRYNFHVNFDPANNRPGDNFGLSPAANIKFKNISRIELVKVYTPVEGYDILTTKDVSNSFLSSLNMNVLGQPFVHVRVAELENNGFGTNNDLDNAFGVVTYDATWASDSASKGKGFTRLIPKFLKAQKEYSPTPLATLQKLTIRLERPNGLLLSDSADTLDISGFVTSAQLLSYPTGTPNVSGTPYVDVSGYHIWIQTKTWFNRNLFSQGDRLLAKNLVFPSAFAGGTQARDEFISYVTQEAGHLIVDVGQVYYNGSKWVWTNTPNLQGYCNCIVIRNRFVDPTTGLIGLQPFGGTTAAATTFYNALKTTAMSSGRVLNQSHQTQLVFRIITREMDAASRLRPDNMNA
jgi:hypothetical protein